jgi:hypothetical protein
LEQRFTDKNGLRKGDENYATNRGTVWIYRWMLIEMKFWDKETTINVFFFDGSRKLTRVQKFPNRFSLSNMD